jgi:ElaB/YqjD/DUF883 family membrane-anchored ribosome-binding protein
MATNYNSNDSGNPRDTEQENPGLSGESIEGIHNTTEEIKDQMWEQVNKIKDQVQEVYESGKAKVEEIVENVKRNPPELSNWRFENLYKDAIGYVQTNPDKALFIALAVGFVVGSLFRRK